MWPTQFTADNAERKSADYTDYAERIRDQQTAKRGKSEGEKNICQEGTREFLCQKRLRSQSFNAG
jgi:hypothetical protein